MTSKELYELIDYFFSRNLFQKNDMTTLVMDDREGRCTVDTFYPFESMRVGLQNVVYQRPEKKKVSQVSG